MPYLRAGALQHRGKLQKKVYAQGGTPARETTYTWVDVIDPPNEIAARIRPISGREFMASQQQQSAVTTEITVRALSVAGVTPAMRFLHTATNLAYNIKAILPDESLQEQIRLMCESGVNAG